MKETAQTGAGGGMITQQTIKRDNMKSIYHLIEERGGISRAQIARTMKLSKTTVSSLADELISLGYIEDTGTQELQTVGRNPNILKLKPSSHYAVCFNWEPETVSVYLVDITGSIVSSVTKQNLSKNNCYIALSQDGLADLLSDFRCPEKILFYCFIVPGMLCSGKESLYTTRLHIDVPEQEKIIPRLRKTFKDHTIILLNDTACYAYAERKIAGIKSNFAYINMASGIGAAITIDGQILGSATGSATQLGQTKLSYKDSRDVLEEEIGESSLTKTLQQLHIRSSLERISKVTYRDIGDAVRTSDPGALTLSNLIAEDLANAILNIITIVGVKLVILGGKSHCLGGLFLQQVKSYLYKYGFPEMVKDTVIQYTVLDENANITGAVQYCVDQYLDLADPYKLDYYIG